MFSKVLLLNIIILCIWKSCFICLNNNDFNFNVEYFFKFNIIINYSNKNNDRLAIASTN